MPKVKTDKKTIILNAIEVFRLKGYHATSMSDLAAACSLQKGSFYHYFPSKEALMTEVLSYVQESLTHSVFSVVKESEKPPKLQLEILLKRLGKVLLKQKGGCIIGNTTLETTANGGVFNVQLKAIFDEWTSALHGIFLSEYSDATALRLAQQTIMEFEGAVMFSQLYENDQFLKDVYVRTLSRLKSNERLLNEN
jgi:TetR/AcrR family transcriptional repressor of nem operon